LKEKDKYQRLELTPVLNPRSRGKLIVAFNNTLPVFIAEMLVLICGVSSNEKVSASLRGVNSLVP
jgi:hypothetical protein